MPDVIEEIKQEENSRIKEEESFGLNKNIEDEIVLLKAKTLPYESILSKKSAVKDIKVIMEGNVQMKQNTFWTKTRKLVVTNQPSIKFYSVKTKEERGSVDVSKVLQVKVAKSNSFLIDCGKRNFEFTTDIPDAWIQCIKKVLRIM